MVTAHPAPVVCPVCALGVADVGGLAVHLVDAAERSEVAHVMWLNRHVTKRRMPPSELEKLLDERTAHGSSASDRVAR
ncbi:MAG: DUF5810 domain-containing protein [Actinomycetota bacterium]|nr:DUF5810 domain-containing protein [Actinomycetota bacterium]